MTEPFDGLTPKERRLVRGVRKALNMKWKDKSFATPADLAELADDPSWSICPDIMSQLSNKDPRRMIDLAVFGIHPRDDSSEQVWKRALPDDVPHTSPKDVLLWALQEIHPSHEQAVIDALDEISPGISSELEFKSEPFEALLRFDNYAVRQILREVDTRELGCALKCARPEIKTLIYANMSKRAAQMLEEDIQCMGNHIHEKTTFRAQKRVMQIAQRLIEEGEITQTADKQYTARPPSTPTVDTYSSKVDLVNFAKQRKNVLIFKLLLFLSLTLVFLCLTILIAWKVANNEMNTDGIQAVKNEVRIGTPAH